MKFKRDYKVPEHLREVGGLPRSQDERLLWIRQRVEEGYYESERVKKAVADAFIDPPNYRRAGDSAQPGRD
jgi:hypothetical protein